MEHDHSELAFNFSYKLVTNDNKTVESEHSKNCMNQAYTPAKAIMPIPIPVQREEDFDQNLIKEQGLSPIQNIPQKVPKLITNESNTLVTPRTMDSHESKCAVVQPTPKCNTEKVLSNVTKQELYEQCECVIKEQHLDEEVNKRQRAKVEVFNNKVQINVESYLQQQNEKVKKRELAWHS